MNGPYEPLKWNSKDKQSVILESSSSVNRGTDNTSTVRLANQNRI